MSVIPCTFRRHRGTRGCGIGSMGTKLGRSTPRNHHQTQGRQGVRPFSAGILPASSGTSADSQPGMPSPSVPSLILPVEMPARSNLQVVRRWLNCIRSPSGSRRSSEKIRASLNVFHQFIVMPLSVADGQDLACTKLRNMTTKRASLRKPRNTGVTLAKSSNTRARRKAATAKKLALAAKKAAPKPPSAPVKAKKVASKAVKK